MEIVTDLAPPIPVALPVGPQYPVEQPHWEGLREGRLLLQHCAACDHWIWSPSWICPLCHTFDLTWTPVDPTGIVYSWTRTHHVFPASVEFRDAVPYVVALIALPAAGGRRLLGILTGAEAPHIGLPVRGWIQPGSTLTDGWSVLRWSPQPQPQASAHE